MSDVKIDLPYGRGSVPIVVPAAKLVGIFTPRPLDPVPDPDKALGLALAEPLASRRLCEIAKGARHVAIAVEDSTRPVPNASLIYAVMNELVLADVTAQQITVVVATGLHRPMTEEELRSSLGRWYGQVAIENHSATDPQRLKRLGTTSLGTDISINRTFLEADVKITTGDVEYHQFCGYGGGAKCVYPGLADAAAICANHSRMDLPGTGPGSLEGNPVRNEVDEVGRMAGLDFNISVAMDPAHRIVAVSAGDPNRSFRHACRFIDQMYLAEIPRRADLVIASPGGNPKDINLYQSQKAIEEATLVVEPGGNVLVTASCDEGSGSADFESWMEEAVEPSDIIRRIQENFVMGGHKAYQIAREVQRAKVHLLSEINPGRVRAWMMHPIRSAADIQKLIQQASSVIVLPQATLLRTQLAAE